MIALPFIYFGLLLVNQLRKNKWQVDIASYILAIYMQYQVFFLF